MHVGWIASLSFVDRSTVYWANSTHETLLRRPLDRPNFQHAAVPYNSTEMEYYLITSAIIIYHYLCGEFGEVVLKAAWLIGNWNKIKPFQFRQLTTLTLAPDNRDPH